MKYFEDGKVQFVSYDQETEEKYTLTLGNLIEDADATVIGQMAESLDTIVDGDLAHAQVVETYHVSL